MLNANPRYKSKDWIVLTVHRKLKLEALVVAVN
jgi:hypothetical protein